MTTKEIINALLKMPDDAEVYIESGSDVYVPYSIKLWVNPEDDKIYQCDIYAKSNE